MLCLRSYGNVTSIFLKNGENIIQSNLSNSKLKGPKKTPQEFELGKLFSKLDWVKGPIKNFELCKFELDKFDCIKPIYTELKRVGHTSRQSEIAVAATQVLWCSGANCQLLQCTTTVWNSHFDENKDIVLVHKERNLDDIILG